MPLIPKRTTRTKVVRHITQLYQENNEELYAYAKFIGEPTAYVLNALIERLQKDDKDYREWRAENRESFVPVPGLPLQAVGSATYNRCTGSFPSCCGAAYMEA